MKVIDWKKYPNFNENECWGNPSKIDERLIGKLQTMREIAKKPIVIHCGTQGEHAPHSYHYSGLAVDLHIKNMSILDQFLLADKMLFGGIGVYQWGLHVDIRQGPTGARWCWWDGYKQLNEHYLRLIMEG